MTQKRAAAYLVLASLLIAWLAAAAGVSRAPADSQERPQAVQTAGTETLAADVQAQAVRLKDRLASAPAPQDPARNPFTFAPREPLPQARSAAAPVTRVVDVPSVASPDPPLALLGIAEEQTPEGPVRTAILNSDGHEVFMVTAGQMVGGRYRVKTIGADAVELDDVVTGAVRRLILR